MIDENKQSIDSSDSANASSDPLGMTNDTHQESNNGVNSEVSKVRANPQIDAVKANMPQETERRTQKTSRILQSEDTAVPAPEVKPSAVQAKSGIAPVTKPGIVAPKKIGKEIKKPSKTKFLLGCAGGGLLLFVVFIVLMVLMMSKAGSSNAVMNAFGLNPAGLKSFLLWVVGISFGLLSIFFITIFVIGVFRLLSAKKGDKETKGKGVKMTVFSLIPLIFVIFIWVILSNFIGRIEIAAEQVIAEIIVVEPEDISSLKAPVEITFSAENVAIALMNGGFEIESMNWDLDGDGVFETPVNTSPTVVHLYNRRGTFTVGLQVIIQGEEELRAPFTKVISISEAVFKAEPDSGYAPLDVYFDASALIQKGFKVSSLDWDFDGDGKYEKEGPDNLKPKYTFNSIGVYSVHLRVIDRQNNVENYYRDIEVVPSDTPLLTAVIDAVPDLGGSIPLQIRFDASNSISMKGRIINYEWDFGDGSGVQVGKSVSHVFSDADIYNVTLVVKEDSGNTAKTTVQVEAMSVSSIPEAMISTDPSFNKETRILNGVLPFKVDFNASDSVDVDNDIVEYQWDFNNDGEIDKEGKKANYIFEKAGTYEVTLVVIDTEGQQSEFTIDVVVAEPGVVAVINAEPEEGTVPLVVQFDGSSSSSFEGNIVSYEWDFGDGSNKTIAGASISHKFNDVGSYTVALSVLTNKSESAETSHVVYVREIPLLACFEPSRGSGDVPLTVTFNTKCSTGSISSYSWDFGDDSSSDSRKPTHTFEYPGNYTVILEVSDDKNNVSTYSDVIVVHGEI